MNESDQQNERIGLQTFRTYLSMICAVDFAEDFAVDVSVDSPVDFSAVDSPVELSVDFLPRWLWILRLLLLVGPWICSRTFFYHAPWMCPAGLEKRRSLTLVDLATDFL